MTRLILVPLDGSKTAEEVLPHVERLAIRFDADVYFLQVIDTRPSQKTVAEIASMGVPYGDLEIDWEELHRATEQYLRDLTKAWRENGITAFWKLAEGKPADRIVETARLRGAFLVAMCTHGRSGLNRALQGSVATEVLRALDDIPVFLVKAKGASPLVSQPVHDSTSP